MCTSISSCVELFDTLAANSLHSIPTLTDDDFTLACRYLFIGL